MSNPNEQRPDTPRYEHLPHITDEGIDAVDAKIQQVAAENLRLQERIELLERKLRASLQPEAALRMLETHYEYELLSYIVEKYADVDKWQMQVRLRELAEPKDD